jgi:hypothetical protein
MPQDGGTAGVSARVAALATCKDPSDFDLLLFIFRFTYLGRPPCDV